MENSKTKLINIAHSIETYGKRLNILVKNIVISDQIDTEDSDFNAYFWITFDYAEPYKDSDMSDEEYEDFRYIVRDFKRSVQRLIRDINMNISLFDEDPSDYFLDLTEFENGHLTMTFYYNVKKMKEQVIEL